MVRFCMLIIRFVLDYDPRCGRNIISFEEASSRLMSALHFEIPDSVLESLQESPDTFQGTMRLLAAAKLVELGRLSTGRAAELAGMGRVEFLSALPSLGVSPSSLSATEVLGDADRA